MTKSKFTWVKTHEDIVNYLSRKENSQAEIIELLKSVGIGPFNDKSKPGEHDIELDEIDPFTFFCYIYKYGSVRRLEFLQKISNKIGGHFPEDESGLPSAQAQKVWFFPYKYERVNNEIGRLWQFFKKALSDNISDKDFQDILKIRSVAQIKVTEALFYINPSKYLPINRPSKQYISDVLELDPTFETYSEYLELLKKVRSKTDLPFYKLSYEAWLWNKDHKKVEKEVDNSNKFNAIQYWEYSPGKNASKWEEFYDKGIIAIGWDEIGDLSQYKNRDQIKNALVKEYGGKGSKKNDVSANDDFLNKLRIGDVIIVKKGRRELLGYGIVSSDYHFDPNRSDFKSIRQVDWKLRGSWKVDFDLITKTLTDITDYESEHPDHDKFYDRLLSVMKVRDNAQNFKDQFSPLNVILYGPPGCGKTWKLQTEYIPRFIERKVKTKSVYYESIADQLSWWETISVVMLDIERGKVNEIFDHPLLQAKSRISTTKTPKNTIWSLLQRHTKDECPNVKFTNRKHPQFFWKSENSEWEIDQQMAKEETPELLEWLEKYKDFDPSDGAEIKRYVFTTFHQSFSYEDFVEGIKPDLDENTDGEVSYKIIPGIFKSIVERAKNDPEHEYAILIDEINRGNIASIFGELITLIEDDKRIDGRYPISARLPYSKEDFSVPSNLFIYGTMNTADRSVEALDSALRRRFTFIEVTPDPEVVKQPDNLDVNLKSLLNAINQRIEILLDKDHKIGHSYFMRIHESQDPEAALIKVFANKVIPLLEEYFYGDLSKVGLILGEQFVAKRDDINESIWAKGDFENPDPPESSKYYLIEEEEWTTESFKSIYGKR